MSQNRWNIILTFKLKVIKEKTNITKNSKYIVFKALTKEFT